MSGQAREPADIGAQMRSLYAADGGVRAVFSNKVHDYCASRPDYPAALFDALRLHAELPAGARVADVGAGTGLMTRGLLERGYRVVAVEPNAAMRDACDALLGHVEGYRGVEGSAEAMPLEDGSVDLVTAAQAFHWFEIDAARAECLRVLTPRGQVALIWNDRVLTDPLHDALDELFERFGGEKRAALLAHEQARANVPAFFGAATPKQLSWPHEHALDEAGLASLVFSRSYMPQRGTPQADEVQSRLHALFERLASDGGTVPVRYTTLALIGRPA